MRTPGRHRRPHDSALAVRRGAAAVCALGVAVAAGGLVASMSDDDEPAAATPATGPSTAATTTGGAAGAATRATTSAGVTRTKATRAMGVPASTVPAVLVAGGGAVAVGVASAHGGVTAAAPAAGSRVTQASAALSAGRAATPKGIARGLVSGRGWSAREFRCLEKLWQKESSWNAKADNPGSSAYGIPQALPGQRMASEGPKWRTDPGTQIRWGIKYIGDRYGSPCSAWAHSRANDWY